MKCITDSIQFSIQPEVPVDSLKDIILDVARKHPRLFPQFNSAMMDAYAVQVCEEMSRTEPETDTRRALGGQLLELLDLIDKTPNPGITLSCVRLCLGRETRSETDIAHRYGVTKADVCKWMGVIRDYFDMTPRCGRKDSARTVFSRKRLDSKPQERLWAGASKFFSPCEHSTA